MSDNLLLGELSRRLGSGFSLNGSTTGSSINAPASNGQVYRAGVGTGPQPVNRIPLPSGNLNPNWRPDPFVTYQPGYGPNFPATRPPSNYVGAPASTSSNWSTPVSKPTAPLGPNYNIPTVNNAYSPGVRIADPFVSARSTANPINGQPIGVNQGLGNPNTTPAPLSGPLRAPASMRIPAVAGAAAQVTAMAVGEAAIGAFWDWAVPRDPSDTKPRDPLAGGGFTTATPENLAGAAAAKPDWLPDWAWPVPQPPDPNSTEPGAMDTGPIVTPGAPAIPGAPGSSAVEYTVEIYGDDGTVNTGWFLTPVLGPVTVVWEPTWYIFVQPFAYTASHGRVALRRSWNNPYVERQNNQPYGSYPIFILRVDGQPEPVIQPATEPERSPAPGRVNPDSFPRILPEAPPTTIPGVDPINPTAPAPTSPPERPVVAPWPNSVPSTIPGTQPLTPVNPVPQPSPYSLPGTSPNPAIQPSTDPAVTPSETPQPLPNPLPDTTPPPPRIGTGVGSGEGPVTLVRTISKYSGPNPWFPRNPLPKNINPLGNTNPRMPLAIPRGTPQSVLTPSKPNLLNPTSPNPNLSIIPQRIVPTPELPASPTCFYERGRVRDIQIKATDTQKRASDPISGFPGLYGIGIETRLKLGTLSDFLKKAWETTRIQKVLDALTFITVVHNAAMLSRFTGETLLNALSQALSIIGIENEEGGPLDLTTLLSGAIENKLRAILGNEVYEDTNKAWKKFNRIVQVGANLTWTLRSIADSTYDLLEYTAENTGRIGNALKRFGVVGENAYAWMSENARARNRIRDNFRKIYEGIESVENLADSVDMVTGTVLEIQEETELFIEQTDDFLSEIRDVMPDDGITNIPVATQQAENKDDSQSPEIPIEDSYRNEDG